MRLCAPIAEPPRSRLSLAAVIARLEPNSDERRNARRASFEFDLMLTPLGADGPNGEPIAVVGRDLCARGVGFVHTQPIEHRRVRLTPADTDLEDLGFGHLQIDLVLRWCRFVSPGCYESGGRVTRTTVPLF